MWSRMSVVRGMARVVLSGVRRWWDGLGGRRGGGGERVGRREIGGNYRI